MLPLKPNVNEIRSMPKYSTESLDESSSPFSDKFNNPRLFKMPAFNDLSTVQNRLCFAEEGHHISDGKFVKFKEPTEEDELTDEIEKLCVTRNKSTSSSSPDSDSSTDNDERWFRNPRLYENKGFFKRASAGADNVSLSNSQNSFHGRMQSNDGSGVKPAMKSILKNSNSQSIKPMHSSESGLSNNNKIGNQQPKTLEVAKPFEFVIKRIGRCNIEIPKPTKSAEEVKEEEEVDEEDQCEQLKKDLYWKVHSLIKEKGSLYVCNIKKEYVARYEDTINPMDQFGLTWTAVCELPYSNQLCVTDLGKVVFIKQ